MYIRHLNNDISSSRKFRQKKSISFFYHVVSDDEKWILQCQRETKERIQHCVSWNIKSCCRLRAVFDHEKPSRQMFIASKRSIPSDVPWICKQRKFYYPDWYSLTKAYSAPPQKIRTLEYENTISTYRRPLVSVTEYFISGRTHWNQKVVENWFTVTSLTN